MDAYARHRLDAIRKLNREGFSVVWRDALDEQRARLDAADRLREALLDIRARLSDDDVDPLMVEGMVDEALGDYEEARGE